MMRPKPRSRMPSIRGRRHIEQRVEIGVDHLIPLVRRHLVEHAVLGDAGIVDQYVDRPELRLDGLEIGRAGLVVADIPFAHRDAGLGLEFLRRLVIAGIACHHLVAFLLERLGDGGTNAACPAGYDRHSSHVFLTLLRLRLMF